jgi:integrase
MSKLYQRRDRNNQYYIRFRTPKGRYKYVATGTTNKRAAQTIRVRLDAELRARTERSLQEKYLPTVKNVVDLWLVHADKYYRDPDGRPTAMAAVHPRLGRELIALHGDLPAENFGPLKLQALRDGWVENNLARSTCNKYTRAVTQMFRYAASQELVQPNIPAALATVRGISGGRGLAKESKKIDPVPVAHVEAIKPFLPGPLRALVEVQLLTGARGGELLGLRPQDLNTSGKVWFAMPARHKTQYRDKTRVIQFGPKAQAILRPLLLRAKDAYVFSPREVVAERAALSPSHRRPDQVPTARKTERVVRDRYDAGSYRKAVAYAIEAHNRDARENGEPEIPAWTPHRLRHTAATLIRQQYGLDAAQAVLGHSSADITQVYAEVDKQKVAAIMEEIG